MYRAIPRHTLQLLLALYVPYNPWSAALCEHGHVLRSTPPNASTSALPLCRAGKKSNRETLLERERERLGERRQASHTSAQVQAMRTGRRSSAQCRTSRGITHTTYPKMLPDESPKRRELSLPEATCRGRYKSERTLNHHNTHRAHLLCSSGSTHIGRPRTRSSPCKKHTRPASCPICTTGVPRHNRSNSHIEQHVPWTPAPSLRSRLPSPEP